MARSGGPGQTACKPLASPSFACLRCCVSFKSITRAIDSVRNPEFSFPPRPHSGAQGGQVVCEKDFLDRAVQRLEVLLLRQSKDGCFAPRIVKARSPSPSPVDDLGAEYQETESSEPTPPLDGMKGIHSVLISPRYALVLPYALVLFVIFYLFILFIVLFLYIECACWWYSCRHDASSIDDALGRLYMPPGSIYIVRIYLLGV